MKPEKVYKLRDMTTGLFYHPSAYGKWTDKGKVWTAVGHVKSSIKCHRNWDLKNKQLEIVVMEMVEVGSIQP